MTSYASYYGIWGSVVAKVALVELSEIVKVIGIKKIDHNQALWKEFNALNEIVKDIQTLNLDESAEFEDSYEEKPPLSVAAPNVLVDDRLPSQSLETLSDLVLFSMEQISLEQIVSVSEDLLVAIENEVEDLEAKITSLHVMMESLTERVVSSRQSSRSKSSQGVSTTPAAIFSPMAMSPVPSKDPQHKRDSSTSEQSMSYRAPKCCSKCQGRLEPGLMIKANAKGIASVLCPTCKEKNKEAVTRAKREAKGSSSSPLSVAVKPSSATSDPGPGSDVASKSKFRRRLQDARDEKHLLEDDYSVQY